MRHGGVLAALLTFVAAAATSIPVHAESYYSYRCENGAQFAVTMFPDARAAYLQLDGRAMTLPKFFSITGTRYRRGGITFWFRGERATIRRAGVRSECRRQ